MAAYTVPSDEQKAANFVALGKKIVCVGKNYEKVGGPLGCALLICACVGLCDARTTLARCL